MMAQPGHRSPGALCLLGLWWPLASLLLRPGGASLQAPGPCPDDAPAEAAGFWRSFFDEECRVEWEDAPLAVKGDLARSTASLLLEGDRGYSAKHTTCRVETVTEGGVLSFDVRPNASAATEEAWTPVKSSGRRVDIVQEKEVASSPCQIFGTGVSKYEIVGEKLDEVMTQITEDALAACPALGHYGVSLHMDQGSTIKAKRTMLEQDGKDGFRFTLKLAVNSMPEPASVQVVVTDSGIDGDEAALREAMLDWERDQDKTRHDENDDGKAGAVLSSMLMQRRQDVQKLAKDPVEDQEERKLAQEKLQEEKAMAQQESESSHQHAGAGGGPSPSPSLSVHPLQGSGQPQDPVTVYGNWTVLDDLITPPLCCLCGSCSTEDAPLCHGGEALAGNTTLAQVSSATAAVSRAERPTVVPLAGFDALESTQPPSRGGLGFGDGAEGPRRFRRRTESGYGDNFHSTVMPKRTAADHAKIWAQSRALIQTVKAEGIQVPDAWHFYDHDDRAKCWQPPPSQGECGSCWAFASVGALEKQICMRAHGSFVPSLSREHLVRCSDQNNACGGGNADKAYEDMMEFGGVLGTDCIPYQGDGSKHCPTFVYSWFGQENQGKGMSRIDQELMSSCHDLQRYSNRPPIGDEWEMPFRMTYEQRWGSEPNMNDTRVARYRQNFAKSRGRDRVPSWWLYSEAAMKAALVKYGAIYASYRARTDFKKRICTDGCWPPGTVWGEEAEFYESSCGCPSGHAVTVIGYGEDIQETGQRVPYWLIENSWGTEKHGNVMGEDDNGIEGWGKDPFTEDHPMKAEDQCVLAGWASSTVPRSGGCGGNERVNIRQDVPMVDGPPDGFFLGVSMDGDMKLNVSVQPDSQQRFMATFPVAPGAHTIKFMVYARRHPKQQSFPVETYHIRATSLRCRGTGYVYSFTKNDTSASLSWGRATRQELEEQAKQILRDNGVNPDAKLSNCDSPCRTGRYSLQEPCLGLLMSWGSCYTSSYVYRSSWYQQYKLADCRNCTEAAIHNLNLAIATQNLNRSAFVQWHNIVMQAFTAPDAPGWMRASRGSCKVNMGGFVTNAQLTATYNITKPNGADGHGACDERHSAPWARGHFVHAPGFMASGSDATTRCPMPLAGNVSLHCVNSVLTVTSNTCHDRAPVSMLGNRLARQHHNGCAGKLMADCGSGCVWTGSDCVRSTQGYFKILRGYNYHGIEEGASFAIAEMDRFVGECPTTGWSRWSTCSATRVCESGSQRRTRAPAPGYDMSNPICADLLLEEVRSCVKPGFCSQVLVRFAAQADASVEQFMPTYRAGSQTLPYARAGATMLPTAYPTCSEAQYWCNMITGAQTCGLYMEGHFNVREDGDYFLRYQADSGAGELHFNALGPGHELDPQFMINSQGEMYVWQDTGFHHRRRRTQVRPWVRAQSFTLSRGTYFARMTRTGWSCPEYRLRLERMTFVYAPALLFGGRGGDGARDAFGRARQRTTTWENNWGAISSHYLRYRDLGYHGYGQLTEQGAANEILLRNERGSRVVKKVPVTKLNFTAEELYAMFGVDKMQPDFPEYTKYELVIRSTVVLPEAGSYRFKYQQDTSQDSSNSAAMSFQNPHLMSWALVALLLTSCSAAPAAWTADAERMGEVAAKLSAMEDLSLQCKADLRKYLLCQAVSGLFGLCSTTQLLNSTAVQVMLGCAQAASSEAERLRNCQQKCEIIAGSVVNETVQGPCPVDYQAMHSFSAPVNILSIGGIDYRMNMSKMNILPLPNMKGITGPSYISYGEPSKCAEIHSAQYCMLSGQIVTSQYLAVPNFVLGNCLPRSCSEEELDTTLTELQDSLQMQQLGLHIQCGLVSPMVEGDASGAFGLMQDLIGWGGVPVTFPNTIPVKTGFWVMLALCLLVLALLAAGTALDWRRESKRRQLPIQGGIQGGFPEDLSLVGAAEASLPLAPGLEELPPKGCLEAFLGHWSLLRNARSFVRCRPADQNPFPCVDAVRSLAMVQVIVGHTYIFPVGTAGLKNLEQFSPPHGLMGTLSFQLVTGCFYGVDSFFLLSGLLCAYSLDRKVFSKPGSRSPGRFFPMYVKFVLYRFLRLVPLEMFCLFLALYMLPQMGSGLLWNMDMPQGRRCSDSSGGGSDCETLWWTNLLFIQDLDRYLGKCFAHTWYLAVDFQLYLTAPFFALAYSLDRRLGWALLFAGLASTVAVSMAQTAHYGWVPEMMAGAAKGFSEKFYFKPWCRAPAFLVGIAVAWLWSDFFACYKGRHSTAWGRLCSVLAALAGILLCSLATFGRAAFYQCSITDCMDAELSPVPRPLQYLWGGFSILAWCVGLGIIMILCFLGRFLPLLQGLLCLEAWQPLAKLCYAAYLVHMSVLVLNYCQRNGPMEWSASSFTFNSVSFIVVSMFAAFCLWISVEKPLANIQARILGGQ